MHVVIRRYTGASSLIAAMEERAEEVEDLLSGVAGLVTYHAVRNGDELATITVCEDEEGIEESTRLAREWVQQNLPAEAVAAPDVFNGESFIVLESDEL